MESFEVLSFFDKNENSIKTMKYVIEFAVMQLGFSDVKKPSTTIDIEKIINPSNALAIVYLLVVLYRRQYYSSYVLRAF